MFSLYEIAWIFYIYSFIGWCTEVIYAASVEGKFVNRGFDLGPVCPIYGIGVTIVLLLLGNVKDNLIILFVSSVLFTSLLEFLAGFVLEKFFNEKWWDYSDQPFNIKGYVCLRFSLLWGLACVFVINLIHPAIMKVIHYIPKGIGIVLLIIFTVTFLTDFTVTILKLLKIRKNINAIIEIESALEKLSNSIGNNLSDRTISAMSKGEKVKESLEEKLPIKREIEEAINEHKEEIDDLKEKLGKYKLNLEKISKHLRSAYPNITKGKYKNFMK